MSIWPRRETVEVKVGEEVVDGQELARVFWNDEARAADAMPLVEGAFEISHQLGTRLIYGDVR